MKKFNVYSNWCSIDRLGDDEVSEGDKVLVNSGRISSVYTISHVEKDYDIVCDMGHDYHAPRSVAYVNLYVEELDVYIPTTLRYLAEKGYKITKK